MPLVGMRTAELIELPLMLAVAYFAASWLIRRLNIRFAAVNRLGMGIMALILLLAAEFGLVLWLRGLTVYEYLESRDPIAGTAYYISLLIFTAMPLIVRRKT
jgi:hypothetical protein